MEKSKLHHFGDCKLPKYPSMEKNKHMKTLAKTMPLDSGLRKRSASFAGSWANYGLVVFGNIK
jgi:hypothetical protein